MADETEQQVMWWGYRHVNGTIQAKRYFGINDLKEAMGSPFVGTVCGPFAATTRDDAIAHIKEILR